MFKKKISCLIAVILTFTFMSNMVSAASFDYKNGLLDQENRFLILGNFKKYFYDNSTSVGDSSVTASTPYGSQPGVRFHEPVWLSGSFIAATGITYVGYYDENDILIHGQNASRNQSGLYTDLDLDRPVKTIKVRSRESSLPHGFFELDFFEKEPDPLVVLPITNLKAINTFNSVELKWDNPKSTYIRNILVKQNGKQVARLTSTSKAYTISELEPETLYQFDVTIDYGDGDLSDPVSIEAKTEPAPLPPEPVEDVSNLKAKPKYDRVDLSWTLPDDENLKHVIIYRDTLQNNFFDKMFGVTTVKAAATPIFETNGTYFNDLTVEPETKYEYTLTTMSTDKIESDGVTVQVTTPKEPDPVIEDGGFEKDPEKGDYTYTWKATTGEVKVMVGGKLYKTVPSSDGKIVIPAADMKFTLFGKPNVELIPVRADGTEGKPVSPPVSGGGGEGGTGGGIKEIELPFKVNDLVLTTFQFIGLFTGIILLALAIQLVPRLIEIIKKSIQNGRTVRK